MEDVCVSSGPPAALSSARINRSGFIFCSSLVKYELYVEIPQMLFQDVAIAILKIYFTSFGPASSREAHSGGSSGLIVFFTTSTHFGIILVQS